MVLNNVKSTKSRDSVKISEFYHEKSFENAVLRHKVVERYVIKENEIN